MFLDQDSDNPSTSVQSSRLAEDANTPPPPPPPPPPSELNIASTNASSLDPVLTDAVTAAYKG